MGCGGETITKLGARHILTGGIAGSTALTVVYPLDVIRRK